MILALKIAEACAACDALERIANRRSEAARASCPIADPTPYNGNDADIILCLLLARSEYLLAIIDCETSSSSTCCEEALAAYRKAELDCIGQQQ